MRLGLLGGTFNPIHRCHLSIAAQTKKRLRLDKVLFIPSGDPPHKPQHGLAPALHRLAMVRLAIESEPTFSVSDVEIHRKKKSYSIDTVRQLRRQYGTSVVFYFIAGLDTFLDLATWHQAERLLRLCHWIVVSRPLSDFRRLRSLSLLPAVPPARLAALDEGSSRQLEIPLPGGTTVTLLALPPCPVSSSEIRRRLRTHRSSSNLLPASVESYIIRFRLYQEEPDRSRVEA